jgi:hypothetical protein
MKKFAIVFALAAAFSAPAFADGNGAGANGGSTGQGNGGELVSLGYFPGWQTASPAKREALAAEQAAQVAKSNPPEALKFPAWVQVSK